MHADMTAVKIQSDKVVLNEVRDGQALLEPSYFLANPISIEYDHFSIKFNTGTTCTLRAGRTFTKEVS